ncbi:MAG: hypothetical protein ACN4GZ_15630 [Acidimicrobiales bacterium]
MSALSAASAAVSAAEAVEQAKATKRRKTLHGYLSDDAHETWHQFATTHGISVSAALESLAVELEQTDDPERNVVIDRIISRARQTDASRRRRR